MSTPNQNKSLHNSVQSVLSISSDVWYDAPELDDGPEEFVLDINQDDQAPGSRIENQSMVEQDSTSIADTDSGEVILTSEEKTLVGKVVTSPRIQLPSLPPADEGSLFTVLKRNIGKVCGVSYFSEIFILSYNSHRISRVLLFQLHSMSLSHCYKGLPKRWSISIS
jgi:hypothetical protein